LGVPDLQSNALVRPAARAASASRERSMSQQRYCQRLERGEYRRGTAATLAALPLHSAVFASNINFFTRSRRNVFQFLSNMHINLA